MDNQMLSTEPKKDTVIISKRQIDRGVVSKAIYMITDFFADNEPLKFALRTSAVEILKDNKTEHVIHLKKLLILSNETGLISEDNIKILIKGIENMQDVKSSNDQSVNIKSLITSAFNQATEHSTDNTNNQDDGYSDVVNIVSKSHSETDENDTTIINTIASKKVDVNQDEAPHAVNSQKEDKEGGVSFKDFESKESINKVSFKKPIPSMVPALDIGTRRKKILEIVKSKGQVTIHEFIQSIQGCSSKTIQRELTSLVLSGTLKKIGERRWSKYSIR